MTKRLVFYEVNPLYYKDGNNDGIGDFIGLARQADYFKYLNVDCVILPNILRLYDSDTKDNSYKKIIPEIGSIKDFQEFSKKMHQLKIKLIVEIDLEIINKNYKWLEKSQKNYENLANKKTESAQKDKLEILEYNEKTGEYYFTPPKKSNKFFNLNANSLKEKLLEIVRFWNKLGILGFRFVNFEFFTQIDPKNKLDNNTTMRELRKIYRSIKEINEDIIVIGKSDIIEANDALLLISRQTQVLDYFQPTNFNKLGLSEKYGNDLIGRFSLTKFTKLMKKYAKSKHHFIMGYGSSESGRVVSRWGGDGEFNTEVSKTLAMIQFFSSSSPLIYYGEEIGAKNIGLSFLDDFSDKTLIERKQHLLALKIKEKQFMSAQVLQNPINSHSLMPWNSFKNGGFSAVEKPLVPTSYSYKIINVKNQYDQADTPLMMYKHLISFFRKWEIEQILNLGKLKIKRQFWQYGCLEIRYEYQQKELVLLANLTNKNKWVHLPKKAFVVQSSYSGKEYGPSTWRLKEYETILLVNNISTIFPSKIIDTKIHLETNSYKFDHLENSDQKQVRPFSEKNTFLDNLVVDKTEDNNEKEAISFELKDEVKANLILQPKIDNNLQEEQKNKDNNLGEKTKDIHKTIEMITEDIENTAEMNFDDVLLNTSEMAFDEIIVKNDDHVDQGAKNKDEIVGENLNQMTNDNQDNIINESQEKIVDDAEEEINRTQSHDAVKNINKDITELRDSESDFLEYEREQSVNNDSDHVFRIKKKDKPDI